MKPFLTAVAVCLLASLSFGQASNKSFSGGVYYSPNYNFGGQGTGIAALKVTSTTAASATAITLATGTVTLPDGRTIQPFATNVPIIVGAGTANAETVTPTTVSGCYLGAPISSCTITVSGGFTNAHNPGELVASGDAGLQEAVNDASANGGGPVFFLTDGGNVSLSTSGATTTVCSSCIPAGALVLGVVARVTTTITGCSGGWELGDGTTATRFTAANGTLTAGTASNADLQTTSGVASTTTGMLAAAAKSIVNTCVTSNASAGAVHVRAWGYVLATPSY